MTIATDPAALDALLANQDPGRWDSFFADRSRPVPFFGPAPDENLAAWIDEGLLRPGQALDLGCGFGRNAVHLARHGVDVQAVDYSETALAWGREAAQQAGVQVDFVRSDVFELQVPEGAYDIVYDGGCFHHIAPHRRAQYVDLVVRALRPGGIFGMTCFRPEGGSGFSDDEVYARGTLGGGLGYTEEQLRAIWSAGLVIDELRPMRKPAAGSGTFGEPFLWVLRAHRA
ncbi:class I SAM-dependent methyltransferase [Ramlibacter algicola]|uniref:Class I SAM-dependent methyltransferase n=1 Tax=Ramlibacter algicola TaxID=2795217 RepID=A0A934UP09_9BURK|nr:class I SAM-dependent methyltransferase [Ramlibacter algicola]MBK0390999.1 class I SAM-dependent methyltransferase [Ramlibacter algicola]